MIDTALDYLRSGLCVLPAILAEKRPALAGWKQYQRRLPTEQQVRTWFTDASALCVLAGEVSGHLEMIDFDLEGELFDRWRELVSTEAPGLVGRVVIERSQSGGRHVVYRCKSPVPGNRKLAQRTMVVASAEPVVICGKRYVPRRVGDRFEITLTLIETRGEGGLFLCAPTPGYRLEQGAFDSIPTLTDAERSILIEAACALTEAIPSAQRPRAKAAGGRPGDEFNERGDVREVLLRHGWELVRGGENEYWRRPGKEAGWSATLKNGVLYVFSSNAYPFEPDKAYSPFGVYAMLEHGGDFGAAAAALRAEGYGAAPGPAEVAAEVTAPDPGPLPLEMLRIPGFVSELMDHCLATAPYPNVPLAFCGAVALQAMLAGRKVRDAGDNRTNFYLLGLAHSSAGKDWPRKINARILHTIGMADCLGEWFASGEGIQDALFVSPAMLFQTDEIDGLLQSINRSKDARHETIMSTLLTMYSSANSIYSMRRKAGKETPGTIDQPHLVLFGTAIPNHYYDALSERMLTNGLFARMIIVECGRREAGQEPTLTDIPPRILDTSRWWGGYRPSAGNLSDQHPLPAIVEHTDDARQILIDARHEAEAEYRSMEEQDDPIGTTVWGRVSEQQRKLALLYAISEDAHAPRIGRDAAVWATAFVSHQTRRMLYQANHYVADGQFDALCLRALRKLQDGPLPHSVLLKRMKLGSKDFRELIETLEQRGDIVTLAEATSGRPQRSYGLAGR